MEDDLALSAGLCFELDAAGYISSPAYNCKKAEYLLDSDSFSLAILDVNLPDGNGFDLCRRLKAAHPGLPVIFLTANDLEEDVLTGFDLGAEDYVTKPFHMQILLRRVEVALRRSGKKPEPQGERWSDGYLSLDFSGLSAVRGKEKLTITPNEYKLLKLMTDNGGQVLTRQVLLDSGAGQTGADWGIYRTGDRYGGSIPGVPSGELPLYQRSLRRPGICGRRLCAGGRSLS